MFGRTERAADVAEGAKFSRSRAGNITETAQVVAIRPDALGIPHVRFNLHIERGKGQDVHEEQRTLSLECFSEAYKDRILA